MAGRGKKQTKGKKNNLQQSQQWHVAALADGEEMLVIGSTPEQCISV